jgi:hypothetical protein
MTITTIEALAMVRHSKLVCQDHLSNVYDCTHPTINWLFISAHEKIPLVIVWLLGHDPERVK